MSIVSSQPTGSSRGGRGMPWNKLMAMLLPLLAVIEACTPFKEPISTCFVRASNSLWNDHNVRAETFSHRSVL